MTAKKWMGSVSCFILLIFLWPACDSGKPTEKKEKTSVSNDGGQSDTTSNLKEPRPFEKNVDTKVLPEPTPEPTPEPKKEVKPEPSGPLPTTFGGKRPTKLKVPSTYNPAKAYPLLIVLHGYGATGAIQTLYLHLNPLVEQKNILMLAPDGTKDPTGKQFWNATNACCDFAGTGIDDLGYIVGLITAVKKSYNVDPKRVYLLGHSNGGFMSYRMACQASKHIAAIASLAGATFNIKSACAPSEPVSILQIHGTSDKTISFTGGSNANRPYPGAEKTIGYWGDYNQCTPGLSPPDATKLDLETAIPGAETSIRHRKGCKGHTSVDLWTIQNGGHIPKVSSNFAEKVWEWLMKHPKQ